MMGLEDDVGSECIQHLAVPGGHPSNYEPGETLLNFSNRAQTVERTPYSVYKVYKADLKPCLKAVRLGVAFSDSGNLFQSFMVRG